MNRPGFTVTTTQGRSFDANHLMICWEKEWINIGKFQDFVEGKKSIIIYANTVDMVWRIGIIEEDK